MPQLCKKCARANPEEAVYCYFDGFVLEGHAGAGGPVAVGAQLFNSPFVFPTGRTCRSFDELAVACQEDWDTACNLLKDGYFESFLGGLGRVDLAMSAKEAARFPDPERGLDQFLADLPSNVLAEPKLRVDPVEVNLGLIDSDQDRTFDLELDNQGMRLLYGTVSSSDGWLTLGDAPGSSEKHFHFTDECRIPVQVRASRVRAGSKPVEAKLLVQSNAGMVTIRVKAEKRVKPFPAGPLEGVKTPRQVAEKAQANPREIAPLFESGDVERWYQTNGWVYPVKIPAASGIAAIQQFFEALGVTKAPTVEISQTEVNLTGDPGQTLAITLEVSTQEKRPVFAHATSNVPWIEVSKPRLNGRTVVLAMSIPSVPNQPGRLLAAELDVISNGNARWKVPVNLTVTGEPLADADDSLDFGGGEASEGGDAFDFSGGAPPAPPPVEFTPPPEEKPKPAKPREKQPARRGERPAAPLWLHVAPALLLAVAVGGVVAFDIAYGPRPGAAGIGAPRVKIAGPSYDPGRLLEPRPRVGVSVSNNFRVGVVMLDPQDPDNPAKWKRLTAREDGSTNNTVIKIGGSEYLFGFETPANRMIRRNQKLPEPYIGSSSVMEFRNEQIRVTQYVQIVPGQDNLLDTVLLYYTVTNYGTVSQTVGVRLMLDTYIGRNDGVPFTAPGEKGFVSTRAEYSGAAIPDYLEVVENPEDSQDAGTIARIGLRGINWGDVDLVEPEKVRICRFPGANMKWEWDLEDMREDSCVAVYWPEREVAPKKSIHVAMTYGLGKLDISESLAISAPSSAPPGREFVVTAYVYKATKDQKVSLELPEGVELVSGTVEQTIAEDSKRTQVFWKVRATSEGAKKIEVVSGRSRAKPVTVIVQKRSIFG